MDLGSLHSYSFQMITPNSKIILLKILQIEEREQMWEHVSAPPKVNRIQLHKLPLWNRNLLLPNSANQATQIKLHFKSSHWNTSSVYTGKDTRFNQSHQHINHTNSLTGFKSIEKQIFRLDLPNPNTPINQKNKSNNFSGSFQIQIISKRPQP